MFKLLNKMVEIKNNCLYTLDPYAYIDFIVDLEKEYPMKLIKQPPVMVCILKII